jgi:hypothetical protein
MYRGIAPGVTTPVGFTHRGRSARFQTRGAYQRFLNRATSGGERSD